MISFYSNCLFFFAEKIIVLLHSYLIHIQRVVLSLVAHSVEGVTIGGTSMDARISLPRVQIDTIHMDIWISNKGNLGAFGNKALVHLATTPSQEWFKPMVNIEGCFRLYNHVLL